MYTYTHTHVCSDESGTEEAQGGSHTSGDEEKAEGGEPGGGEGSDGGGEGGGDGGGEGGGDGGGEESDGDSDGGMEIGSPNEEDEAEDV